MQNIHIVQLNEHNCLNTFLVQYKWVLVVLWWWVCNGQATTSYELPNGMNLSWILVMTKYSNHASPTVWKLIILVCCYHCSMQQGLCCLERLFRT